MHVDEDLFREGWQYLQQHRDKEYSLTGIEEVEIRKEGNLIVVVPVSDDPILQLGAHPIADSVEDASENHDAYIYGR